MLLEDDTDGEINQAVWKYQTGRQISFQINHKEVKILTGHTECHLQYLLLR